MASEASIYICTVLLLIRSGRTYTGDIGRRGEEEQREKFLLKKKTKKSTKNMGFMCPFNAASAG